MTGHTDSTLRFALTVASCALALATVSTAHAEDDEPEELEISLGAKGGVTTTGATEVPEQSEFVGFDGEGDPELYGMFGAGAAGGPALDIRYKRVVGLETALYFTNDSAKGTNDVKRPSGEQFGAITQSQSTTALHIPVLLKASVPSENVRPVFGAGLEFVSQQSSELEYTSDDLESAAESRNDHNSVESASYTLLQFTAGVEIDAGPLRIPIELRAGYNLGWNDTFSDRVDVPSRDPERFVYDGEYLGHLGVFAGVLYRWGIDL
jgi:hypothetical protein